MEKFYVTNHVPADRQYPSITVDYEQVENIQIPIVTTTALTEKQLSWFPHLFQVQFWCWRSSVLAAP